jgi:NTP pyrophosphatase (non-canonical NTP hydrolase)
MPRNTLQENYVDFVKGLLSPKMDRLGHAVGLSGEAGEVLEIFKKHVYHNKPLDNAKVLDEAGDVCFYLTALLDAAGYTIEDAMRVNVAKLSARYPGGFSLDYKPKDEAVEAQAMQRQLAEMTDVPR